MNPRRSQNTVITVGLMFLCIGGILWFSWGVKHTDETYKRLLAIEGITSVKKVDLDKSYGSCITDKYLVTFEQPIDWKNPELGTFDQRVEIGITDRATVNFMELDGYALHNDRINLDYAPELVEMYKGNYIHVEHRFFGSSSPDDFSYDETGYWEYLTCENSAADYHNIFSKLEPLLGDDWACFGGSYGGLLTDAYASFYPQDCRLYVSYVAPCTEGTDDTRFYDFIYNSIGDDVFGKDKAKEYRDQVTDLQVDLINNKQELMGLYNEAIDQTGMRFRERAKKEVLYDLNVLEFAVAFWQYSQDFDRLGKVLAMPEDTAENKKAKREAEIEFMLSVQGPADWSPDMYAWPYYVSAATEVGSYYYDFSYLRAALKKVGIGDILTISEDMEETLLADIVFTDEQKEAFKYSSAFRDNLISSLKSTDARILRIYGASDPWYSLRLPDIRNDNIKVYVHPELAHQAKIETFPDDTKKEIQKFIDECIGE